jgi:hypothetical protein
LDVVLVYDFLRGDALPAGFDGDGHAVLIGAADEGDVPPLLAQVTYVDVGGQVAAGQVTDVNGPVGVDQAAVTVYRWGFCMGISGGRIRIYGMKGFTGLCHRQDARIRKPTHAKDAKVREWE